MSRIARDPARRLAAGGVDASGLTALVSDMAAARAEAINHEGLEAQIAYLLEAYGCGEIEHLALGNPPREERP
jgi:hypothetical protein